MDIILKSVKSHWNLNVDIYGDKSIAHRSLIIGALPEGNFKIYNYPKGEDCITTINIMRELGVLITEEKDYLKVNSPGYENFKKKVSTLNCNNSGTTTRLIAGLLAGCGIESKLIGDDSLMKRPMKRIVEPLKLMGAEIEDNLGKLPLIIKNKNKLNGISYELPVPSAQVKSAILIAGFLGEGNTTVIEKILTRDHTERMFKYLGAKIEKENKAITIKNSKIECKDIVIPGDPSSAAFLVGATLLSKDSSMIIKDVLLNEGRIKYIDILKKMGGKIEIIYKDKVNEEKIGDLIISSSDLKSVIVEKDEIPSIIDEIPMLSVLAAFIDGETIFKGIEELQHKETDRGKAIVLNLEKLGIKAEIKNNNLYILGKNEYIEKNVEIETFKDHRIALAFLLSAFRNKGITTIKDYECTNISFPNSLKIFENILEIEKLGI